VDAANDIDPPRRWRQTDISRPGDRLVFAALTAWRDIITAGRCEISTHAQARMAERGITLEELVAAVWDGRIIPASAVRESVRISGGYLHGNLMVVVDARCLYGTDFRDLVPTVRTLYRTEPLDPAQPLTMPLSAFVEVRAARFSRLGSFAKASSGRPV
jgi:hypothetical protein